MTFKTSFVLLSAVSSVAALAGCSGSSNQGTPNSTVADARASLHRAKGCGDLLSDLKADAKYKVNKGINRQIENTQKCIAKIGDQNCAGYGGYRGGGDAPMATSEAGSAAPPSSSSSSSSGGGAAPASDKAASYSETNVQVKGVDEADIVKTDGSSLFVLHGNALKVVKAWPANTLKEATSTTIEGNPSEMFVADGKAVVYSTVNGAAIFAAAGVTPKNAYYDWGYYGGGGGRATPAIDIAPGYPGDPGQSSGPYVPLTKVTVVDLAGATPTVAREMYFEGGYLDSRRVGDHVRTVLQGAAHGPKLLYGVYDLYPQPVYGAGADPASGSSSSSGGSTPPTQDPYPKTGSELIAALEKLRATNLSIIDQSQLADWLPYTFVREGAGVRAQTPACADVYMPNMGSAESGFTEIASFDLKNATALPKETGILGYADTVYGSADTLYLAARAWVEPPFSWQDYGYAEGGTVAVPPSSGTAGSAPGSAGTRGLRPRTTTSAPIISWANEQTNIHKFEFATDPTFPNYVASGSVVGAIKDQFSMDDRQGYLRISTTESRSYFDLDGKYVSPDFSSPTGGDQPQSVNHVFVLGQQGPWLDTVGDAGELAPGERIYSTRFVGTRGYVTTFRQVDPLFVFDLADPQHPKKLAELKIPGFSEYMHPLGETHLLTIGRDADPKTGRAKGLELRIFDVTNGAAPKIAQQFTYNASEYGSSDAEYDHKAFTFFAEKNLLAFPYYSYGSQQSRSSLEVFKVDIATGFQKAGSIDHTPLLSKEPQGWCGGYYAPSVRRGVFLENWVYSVSYGGIVAKDSSDMASAGYSTSLSSPQTNQGYGPVCAY